MLYSPRRHYRRRSARSPIERVGAGGIILMTGGVFVGFWGADLIHRWASTLNADPAAKVAVPAGFTDIATYNAMVVDARPSMKSLGFQFLYAGVNFALGAWLKPSWAKLLFFGMSAGAVGHMGTQLANTYIILPLFKATAQKPYTFATRAFAHEIQSNAAVYPVPPPATGTTAGLGAPPALRQAPPMRALPSAQPVRMPAAMAAQPVASVAGGARPSAPFRGSTLAAPFGRLGQTTPPANTVPNLPNGNCPDGTTTVQNPDNLDLPWCVAPAAPPPTQSTPVTPPPSGPPPTNTPPPPVTFTPPVSTPPTAAPPVVSPPPSQFSNAPTPPQACPPGCQSPLPDLVAASAHNFVHPALAQAAITAAAPCCGQSPCGCGCQNAMGAPPPPSGPTHPIFANLQRTLRGEGALPFGRHAA